MWTGPDTPLVPGVYTPICEVHLKRMKGFPWAWDKDAGLYSYDFKLNKGAFEKFTLRPFGGMEALGHSIRRFCSFPSETFRNEV